MQFDYSSFFMTTKCKTTFCGNKINEVCHTFECTTQILFLQLRLSLHINDTQNIFGLLFCLPGNTQFYLHEKFQQNVALGVTLLVRPRVKIAL